MRANCPNERLVLALEQSDAMNREARASRLVWLSENQMDGPGIVCGPVDTLALRAEARDCFANGHFIAALILAVSFIEHVLFDELNKRGLAKERDTLEALIASAKANHIFPNNMLDRANRLRLVRNPYAHRKPDGHKDTLGKRILDAQAHPQTIFETDAKEALSLMYEFFRATLRDV